MFIYGKLSQFIKCRLVLLWYCCIFIHSINCQFNSRCFFFMNLKLFEIFFWPWRLTNRSPKSVSWSDVEFSLRLLVFPLFVKKVPNLSSKITSRPTSVDPTWSGVVAVAFRILARLSLRATWQRLIILNLTLERFHTPKPFCSLSCCLSYSSNS